MEVINTIATLTGGTINFWILLLLAAVLAANTMIFLVGVPSKFQGFTATISQVFGGTCFSAFIFILGSVVVASDAGAIQIVFS